MRSLLVFSFLFLLSISLISAASIGEGLGIDPNDPNIAKAQNTESSEENSAPTSAANEANGSNLWLYLGVSIVVLVVVALSYYFIRKHRNTQYHEVEAETQEY